MFVFVAVIYYWLSELSGRRSWRPQLAAVWSTRGRCDPCLCYGYRNGSQWSLQPATYDWIVITSNKISPPILLLSSIYIMGKINESCTTRSDLWKITSGVICDLNFRLSRESTFYTQPMVLPETLQLQFTLHRRFSHNRLVWWFTYFYLKLHDWLHIEQGLPAWTETQ